MKLHPYQIAGAAFLAARRAAFLADEPGLGKTAQAIEAANLVAGELPVLVVAPASVRSAWTAETARLGRGPRFEIVSYDGLIRNHADYMTPWGALILDEAHYLANPETKRTRAIYGARQLACMAAHTWALSGTPAPGNPSQLWPHMAALFPESLRTESDPSKVYNFDAFVNRYCQTRQDGFGGRRIVGGKKLDNLRSRLDPYLLRRTKKEVLPDLPSITYEPLLFDAPAAVAALSRGIPDEEMARAQKALQSGNAADLEAVAGSLAELRRVTASVKTPLVSDWIADFLEGSDRKLVVFAWHREPIEALAKTFPKAVVLHGGTRNRAAPVWAFQNDPGTRLFIGQITAAGTGITLTAASDLLFLEQSWTPSDNLQAAMRINRIGQTRGCMIRFATLAGSIDEAVQRVVARKAQDISKLFD